MTSDERQIEHLLYRYAELIDAGDFAGIGQLFAHGTITDAAGVAIASGAEQVTRLYETTTRRFADDGTPKTKHIASNVIVDLSADGRTASVRSYFVVMQRVGDEPLRPIVAGRYHDRLELTDGAWQFRERRMVPEMFGDVSQHLLFDVRQLTDPEAPG